MTKLVFLDTETTSLDRRKRLIWDIGYIIRETDKREVPDREVQYFVPVSLAHADPMSLKIGGYYERHPAPYQGLPSNAKHFVSREEMHREVAKDLSGAYIIGAVPSFDEETLERGLHAKGLAATWHYHLIDIESMAAGALGWEPPYNFDELLKEFGLAYHGTDRHTAIGDARMVRNLYDAVLKMGRDA